MNDNPKNTTDPEPPGVEPSASVEGGTDPEPPGQDDTVGFAERATDPEPPGGG